MNTRISSRSLVALLSTAMLSSFHAMAIAAPRADAPDREICQEIARLPLAFEENVGQTDASVRFLARGTGCALFLTGDETVLRLDGNPDTILRMKLVGSSGAKAMRAGPALPGTSRYFLGDDPSRWGTEAPHYQSVVAESVYPGVDVVYYGTDQRVLEYDLVLAPGVDPRGIEIEFAGQDSASIDGEGNLVLKTAAGDLVQRLPVAFQEKDGVRETVECHYRLDGTRVRFDVGTYDRTRTLTIDPQLYYFTFLGTSGLEMAWAFEMFGGFAYVTGHTTSSSFPLGTNAYDRNANGNEDVFVTVFSPGSNTLLCSTYLGGSNNERPTAIAVDGAGIPHICGYTDSTNFPVTSNRMRGTGREGFVLMVSPYVNGAMALSHSTYFGGNGDDECWDIALDAAAINYLTGYTRSSNFPTTSGAYRRMIVGGADAFVTSLSPYTDAIVYSTYLGGTGDDYGGEISLRYDALAYVAGHTWSANFPTTTGCYDATFNGVSDGFVTKINATGSQLVFSTFFGGTDAEWLGQMVLTSTGEPMLVGQTKSANFPVSSGAYDTSYNGGTYGDGYLIKLNAAGSQRMFATFFGGTASDGASGVAIGADGSLYLCGFGDSVDLPTSNPVQSANGGMWDAWMAKMNSNATQLTWSTYFGGTGNDAAFALSIDTLNSRVYYCGYSGSNLTGTMNAFDRSFNGGTYDAMLVGLTMN